MSYKLTPHIPRWLLRRLAGPPSAAAPGRVYTFDAAVLYLDIVGFTALTEEMAAIGPRGVEVLGRVLDTVFGTLVSTISAFGGDVTDFGGDAITSLWVVGEERPRAAVLRACAAALNLRALMGRLNRVETPSGPHPLAIRLGIGYGPAAAFILGSEDQRLWTVAGPAMEGAVAAELSASPNQVRLHPSALEQVGAAVAADEDGNLISIHSLVRPRPPRRPPVDDVLVQPFVHPVVASREWSAAEEFIGEFRPVVPLFVRCDPPPTVDADDPPAFGEWLNTWVQAAQSDVRRFDGWLSTVEVGDKGNVLLVQFGTLSAHEDDERRAVECALTLLETGRTLFPDMGLHVGITRGRLFEGTIGSPERHAHSLVGDEINLAARLMSLAQSGQVLISGRVRQAVSRYFAFRDVGPVVVRGRRQSVPVFEVQRGDGRRQFFGRMLTGRELVGRERELRLAEEVIGRAWEGRPQVLTVGGEAGIGKSHLAAVLLRRWTERGGTVVGGECLPFTQETPYLPWRRVVIAAAHLVLGDEDTAGDEETASGDALSLDDLARALEKLPPPPDGEPGFWAQRLPLLAEVLGFGSEDNALTDGLTGEARRDNLFATVQALLRAAVRTGPLLVLVEDMHWADDPSLQLMAFLTGEQLDGAVLFLFTHRPLPEPLPEPWRALTGLPNHTAITLTELDAPASRRLVGNMLGVAAVPDDLARMVFERAHGHPFFTEEIIRMFQDVGCVWVEGDDKAPQIVFDRRAAAVIGFPDTVEGVVQARVDQLSEDDRLTLKVASVIGRQFPYNVLAGVYPVEIEDEVLLDHLRTAEQLGLTLLERPEPQPEYVFKHSITHEVVYQGLAFAQRRKLHAAVARWYEQRYAGNLGPYYSLLAYHYGRAGKGEMELHYLLLAADRANRIHAVSEAVRYYERALELLDREQEPARAAHVLMQLGYGLHYTARYERAQEYFQQALALYEQVDDHIHAAEACFEIANRLEVHDLEAALRYTKRGLDYVRDRPDARHQFIVGSANLGHLYRSLGHHQKAEEFFRQALELAQETNDLYGLWKCYRLLSIYHYSRGDLQQALEYGQKVIRYAELANAPVQHRIIALNNQACFAQEAGAVQTAIEVGEAGLALARRSGVISEQVILASTLAGIYNHVGDWERAEQVLSEGMRLLAQHYHPYHEVALNIEAGAAAGGRGDWRKAVTAWAQAEEKSLTGSAQLFTAELRVRLAEGWVHLGDLEQAERWLNAAEPVALAKEQQGILVAVYRVRGMLARMRGLLEEARAALERSLTLARELHDAVGAARTLLEYGETLVEAGRFDEGVERLREAERTAQEAGLYPVAQAAQERLRSLDTLPL